MGAASKNDFKFLIVIYYYHFIHTYSYLLLQAGPVITKLSAHYYLAGMRLAAVYDYHYILIVCHLFIIFVLLFRRSDRELISLMRSVRIVSFIVIPTKDLKKHMLRFLRSGTEKSLINHSTCATRICPPKQID